MLRNKSQPSTLRLRSVKFLLLLSTIYYLLSTVLFAREEFVYDPKGKRNPFMPLVAPDGRLLKLDEKEQEHGDLVLEGIIYDKYGQSCAIVSSRVVKIGDEVGGYQVLKIEKNKVIFVKDGQPKEVELKEEE